MTQIQVGSFQWMKSMNKSTILNVIRLHGPISRAEIAKITRLTAPTVTNIVGELLESGLVVESNLGESTGGRKPIMLRINSSAFYIIGVYAGAKKINAVIATLDGHVVYYTETKVPAGVDVEGYVGLLKKSIHSAIEGTKNPVQSFVGIGIGMHGLVDPEKGISIFAPNLNLANIPVKTELEKEFMLPVEIENDVRAIALGESWFGQGQGIANFICVNVGTGVGAGIILDHHLYHGASYTAGEIGHTTIDIHGPKCSCGNYGCLETLTSGPAIVKRIQKAIRIGKQTVVEEYVKGDLDAITGEMVANAAAQGDTVAIEVLADTGRYLGIGIANLINTFNPSRIILSGGVSRAGDFVLQPLKETVEHRSLAVPAKSVTIVKSELGPHAIAVGAVTLVLHKLFTPQGVTEV
ncbi:ROK family transcriptional regulator [Aneurinibacillus terranovensis]|uniref:ROK family transcriptional regulator n=1 Tax=Aneurinibacillus terranovensis TaxID=278991 RepID=UPI00040122DC|nr:ROK family transcriptional regulator [Aneurinibacillus terranovensis]